MNDLPLIAYKVMTGSQMVALEVEGLFAGAPIDLADGFIHLSTDSQVTETVDKHFAEQTHLHLVAVDLAVLGAAVKWEPSRGGQLFPHIYAPLPLDAVLAYGPLERDQNGAVRLPVAG
jgi:uncharacterized protein (DUF952 family)